MALTIEEARGLIEDRLVANGANPEKVDVLQKGEGVFLAYVRLVGDDQERQGVFTEAALVESQG